MDFSSAVFGILIGITLMIVGWICWKFFTESIIDPLDMALARLFDIDKDVGRLDKASSAGGELISLLNEQVSNIENSLEATDKDVRELTDVVMEKDGNLDACMERTKLAIEDFVDFQKRLDDFEKQLDFMSSNAFLYYGVRAKITQNGTGVHTAVDKGATIVKTLKLDDEVTISEIRYHNGVAWARIGDNQWIHSGWEVMLK